jgi:hypothetical protein
VRANVWVLIFEVYGTLLLLLFVNWLVCCAAVLQVIFGRCQQLLALRNGSAGTNCRKKDTGTINAVGRGALQICQGLRMASTPGLPHRCEGCLIHARHCCVKLLSECKVHKE